MHNVHSTESGPIRVLFRALLISIVLATAMQVTPRGRSVATGTIIGATHPLEFLDARRVRVVQYVCDYGWPMSSFSSRYAEWTLAHPGKTGPNTLVRRDYGEVLEDHPFLPRPGERQRSWRPSRVVLNLVIIIASSLLVTFMIINRRRRRVRRLRAANRCIHCGYFLTGVPEPRCPECGTPFDYSPYIESQS